MKIQSELVKYLLIIKHEKEVERLSRHNDLWSVPFVGESNRLIGFVYEADQNKENYSIKDGVVTIASGVFYNNTNLKSVTIPSSVKNIGTYAFSGCTNLTEVILPDGLENIGYAAFMSSGIKEITVPKSVKNIGQDAFLNITVNR